MTDPNRSNEQSLRDVLRADFDEYSGDFHGKDTACTDIATKIGKSPSWVYKAYEYGHGALPIGIYLLDAWMRVTGSVRVLQWLGFRHKCIVIPQPKADTSHAEFASLLKEFSDVVTVTAEAEKDRVWGKQEKRALRKQMEEMVAAGFAYVEHIENLPPENGRVHRLADTQPRKAQ